MRRPEAVTTTFEDAAVANQDLAVMLRGWEALQELYHHADVSMGPLLSTGPHCEPCSKFAQAALRAASLGRAPTARARRMRCQPAQLWEAEVAHAETTYQSWRERDNRD